MTDAARRERAMELYGKLYIDEHGDVSTVERDISFIAVTLADAERRGMERAATLCEADALIDDERGYYGKEMAKSIRAKAVQ